MNVETAWATRTCQCGATILKGEEHYANYKRGWRQRYRVRKNYCMICALQFGDLAPEAEKYLQKHPDIKNRLTLKRIQLGVALR
jgi:hypothetical protein